MPSLELNAINGAGSDTQVRRDGCCGPRQRYREGTATKETGPGPGHTRDRRPLDSPQSRPVLEWTRRRERRQLRARRTHPLPVDNENG